MKVLFLLWIAMRCILDAAAWATALWCLLYSFTSVQWLQCFWVFLAIHFVGNLPSAKYIRTHTRRDCLALMRRESVLVCLSILCAPIIAILPAIASILLLSYLQAWTNLETHWLHTLLFVTCVVYNLLRGREKRRKALHENSERAEWVGSLDSEGKVVKSAPRNGSRSVRVIDV